jgi:diguanylate cyclase (GGDEF)-like protein
MRGYGLASLALIALYPFLPFVWAGIEVLVVFVGALVCVGYGRRAVVSGRRQVWTLLAWALVVFMTANVVLFMPGERPESIGRLIDAVGYLLLLAAALALIIRRGTSDLGGVIDAAVIALAVGSVLWVMLPHRLGPDQSVAAQVEIFVVFFALSGVLGALLRLATIGAEVGAALWWLLGSIGLVISGNAVLAVGGGSPAVWAYGIMLLMGALTAVGLFGLDVTAARLVHRTSASREQLSTARLVFLGIGLTVVPVLFGTRLVLARDTLGLLLAIQGTLVAALVMGRVGLLSAQRSRAERTLEHQATHDPLTQLPNRRQFVTQLRNELDRGARCVLLFCDLDGFKAVNDRLGHDVGDSLLIEVARRLVACAGPSHVVSRFGGDEFAALLIDIAPDQAHAVRAGMETVLHRPFEQAAGAGIGVNIGIAFADGERDPEQLIRTADHAMYQEKASHAEDRPGTG